MLPESLPPERRSSAPLRSHLNPIGIMIKLLDRPILRIPLLAMFLLNGAFSGMQSILAVFLNGRFGFGPTQVAPLFVALALTGIVMQGLVVRKLSQRYEDSAILLMGVVSTVLAFIMIGLAFDPLLLFPAMVLLSAGNALWRAPLTSLMTKLVSEREQGMVNGGGQSTAALSAVVGPIATGIAYERISDGAPFYGGAVAILLACVAMVAQRRGNVVPASDAPRR
jgi:predicted MFS family arabinose efflux permease